MPDPVAVQDLVANARRFLTELAANNTREWFQGEKHRYDSELKRPAERLLGDLAPHLEALAGAPVRQKLFRPHRDIRFSTDKTPYHTHLHLAWSIQDGRGWYFGLSPSYATAGAGIMAFDKVQIDRWRDAVAGPRGTALTGILDQIGGRIDPPELKRVPPPFPGDHPHHALLRRKGLTVWVDDLAPVIAADPFGGLSGAFERLSPVMTWLGDTL
ncbi:TIGR02453 family protein [Thalassococcus sp. CAU 1522]|uniref:TIGR02453 family protein n=1 Tax=Thalassococcus arenae TaxID=2851652 RepID=A0ABS6N338_9RHOB|nr:TIGR02453 family protein [Thalassococcus arenae]MBV2358432.1 TIGR02453 family protein [Thalassococcus arenae]